MSNVGILGLALLMGWTGPPASAMSVGCPSPARPWAAAPRSGVSGPPACMPASRGGCLGLRGGEGEGEQEEEMPGTRADEGGALLPGDAGEQAADGAVSRSDRLLFMACAPAPIARHCQTVLRALKHSCSHSNHTHRCRMGMYRGTGTNTSRRLSTKQRSGRAKRWRPRRRRKSFSSRLGMRVAGMGYRVPGTWTKACYRLHSTRQVGLACEWCIDQ
jgi:hypothetical protein